MDAEIRPPLRRPARGDRGVGGALRRRRAVGCVPSRGGDLPLQQQLKTRCRPLHGAGKLFPCACQKLSLLCQVTLLAQRCAPIPNVISTPSFMVESANRRIQQYRANGPRPTPDIRGWRPSDEALVTLRGKLEELPARSPDRADHEAVRFGHLGEGGPFQRVALRAARWRGTRATPILHFASSQAPSEPQKRRDF